MFASVKSKMALLLLGTLVLLAAGSAAFTAVSVRETLSEKMLESARNAVFLSANNVRDKYSELFNRKLENALRVKKVLALYERLIKDLAKNAAGFPAILGNLPLAEGMSMWAVDAGLRARMLNGGMPPDFNPYARTDIKGRAVGENMLRAAALGTQATALVQRTAPGGGVEEYFGYHFFVPGWERMIGLWMDLAPYKDAQARGLAEAIESLRDNFREVHIGQSGFLLVADAAGEVIIRPEHWEYGDSLTAINPASDRKLIRDVVAGAATPEVPVSGVLAGPAGAREVLVYVEYIRPLKWYVAGTAFVDEITAPGRRLSLSLAAAMLIAAGVLALVALGLLGRLTVPLARLAQLARQLPGTDFLAERDDAGRSALQSLSANRRGDEVGELSKAFLFMDGAIRARVRELVETTSSRERMAGDLRTATQIQMGFLPKPLPEQVARGRFSLAGLLIPAREVGGDLYEFFMLDEHRLCLVIGDVSDKGVPAALFMSMTMVLIRSHAPGAEGPEQVMDLVNNHLARENPNSMFVTLFIAFLDLRSGELTYANAGHNPPLALAGGQLREFGESSGPVAAAFAGASYRRFAERLRPGELVFLYTDGLSEAMNEAGALFGEEAVRRTLLGAAAGDPEEVLAAMRKAVERHVDGAPASDDLTMLCVRFKAFD